MLLADVCTLVAAPREREQRTASVFTWRCRRELHPRMGVLQTPALLLGYGTTREKIEDEYLTLLALSEVEGLLGYGTNATGILLLFVHNH